MSEISPENTPIPEVEEKQPLFYRGRHEDVSPTYKRNRRMIVGSIVASLGISGAAIAGISSAGETGYISLNPAVSAEATVDDYYTYDPGVESTESPIDSGFTTTESWGEDCTSSITVNYDGSAIDVETEPTNPNNTWTAVRYVGVGAEIEHSNDFEADWLTTFGTSLELYSIPKNTSITAFDADNRNYEKCGEYKITGYDDLGAPIIINTAEELTEDPELEPSPTPEAETPVATNDEPLVFEAQEFNGNKYNCALDGNDVEVFFSGQAPDGYKLAVSAIEHRDMEAQIEVIAFVNNNGRAELPETDGRYLDIKVILVPEDTSAGFQEFASPPDRLEFQYEQALKDGQFNFAELYPWQEGDVTNYDNPAGKCY